MFRSTAYRYPSEIPILLVTVFASLAAITLTAVLTQCLSLILVLGIMVATVLSTSNMQNALMTKAFLVHPGSAPEIARVVETCHKRLKPGPLQVYILREKIVNAYTFGLKDPKYIVLFEPMLKIMNDQELAFVIGHEMGHVALGHTWLNTFIGGLAGSPSAFGVGYLIYIIFKSWSRACEMSCDRAGLLACGSLNSAVTALLRLAAPNISSEEDLKKVLVAVDREDDTLLGQTMEAFQSHPLIIKRINQLKEYAATQEYKQLQAAMDKNLSI